MELVVYEIANRAAYITLNRPDKRNALNSELVASLSQAFSMAKSDKEVKVIVLKASGQVFSAGADLEYLQQLQNNSEKENLADTQALKDLFYSMYTSQKIIVAQVEGHAIAGGCGLVSVCDIIFSVPEAKFGYTEVKIGFIPALVACFLIRRLGEGRAKELLLSGDLIDAITASNYGLINFVIDKSEINDKVSTYVSRIISTTSEQSLGLTKKLLNKTQDLTLEESLEEAIKLNVQTRSSADCKKGVAAFLSKQKLKW